ncbi:MAG: hypothetical protein J6V32_04705 [Elusimicrobiaceae bacterium]|nr:hypothetical protein [Elusimicrobiaceae bacterium]
MRQLKTYKARLLSCKKGQATIEYVLMLATILVVLSAFLTAFHTHIVRYLFTFIGMIITT